MLSVQLRQVGKSILKPNILTEELFSIGKISSFFVPTATKNTLNLEIIQLLFILESFNLSTSMNSGNSYNTKKTITLTNY
jgi:hypothetical protein